MANPNQLPSLELNQIIELAIDGLKLALAEKRLSFEEALEQAKLIRDYQDEIRS